MLFAPDTDHHSGHVITGLGTILKLVRTRRPEWIGQVLLISLLRYKTTFYKVQQENESFYKVQQENESFYKVQPENGSLIVSSVAAFRRIALLIFKPKKEHFCRGMFDHLSHICYLLDICDRMARQFSLGKQARFSKELHKVYPFGVVHIDAFSNPSAFTENACIQTSVFKSLRFRHPNQSGFEMLYKLPPVFTQLLIPCIFVGKGSAFSFVAVLIRWKKTHPKVCV